MSVYSLLLINDALLEIDHIFICIKGAFNKSLLEEIGLVCSDSPIRHRQQGTASSLIFFENTYLEFIWVEDETAAEIYAMRSGIDFLARSCWRQTNASPFGIALRQKPDAGIQKSEYPTESHLHVYGNQNSEVEIPNSVDADQLPQVFQIQNSDEFINFAASNLAAQAEPLCYIIPDSISLTTLLDRTSEAHRQLTSHPLGLRELTNTKVAIEKLGNLTAPISMLLRDEIIEIEQNAGSPHLELTFDDGNRGGSVDLRSLGIPLEIKY